MGDWNPPEIDGWTLGDLIPVTDLWGTIVDWLHEDFGDGGDGCGEIILYGLLGLLLLFAWVVQSISDFLYGLLTCVFAFAFWFLHNVWTLLIYGGICLIGTALFIFWLRGLSKAVRENDTTGIIVILIPAVLASIMTCCLGSWLFMGYIVR